MAEDKRTRWCVVNFHCRAYCVRDGKLSWTFDKEKAEKAAKTVSGVVVDADEFSKNPTAFFDKYQPKENQPNARRS